MKTTQKKFICSFFSMMSEKNPQINFLGQKSVKRNYFLTLFFTYVPTLHNVPYLPST